MRSILLLVALLAACAASTPRPVAAPPAAPPPPIARPDRDYQLVAAWPRAQDELARLQERGRPDRATCEQWAAVARLEARGCTPGENLCAYPQDHLYDDPAAAPPPPTDMALENAARSVWLYEGCR